MPTSDLPIYATRTATGLSLQLHVVPGARTNQIIGIHGDRLKVRVTAPPEDGRANAAVEAIVGAWLGVSVQVIAGHTARKKTVLACGWLGTPPRGNDFTTKTT